MPKLIAGVAVSLIVAPIFRLISIVSIQIPALFGERYQFYIERYPGLAGLLYFELAMNLILIGSALVLNVLFYTKNRRFPVYMIAYAAATFLYLLAVTGAVRTVFPNANLTTSFVPLVRWMIWAAALIPYLLYSPEVKARFQG